MNLDPYLFFEGCAEEALNFYASALDGSIEGLMRFSDAPAPIPPECLPPGGPLKLMHASLNLGSQRIMMSDGVPLGGFGFRSFSLALQFETEPEARRAFEALCAGGRADFPLAATFFSPCYGMLTDRFGVQWTIMVTAPALPSPSANPRG
jgi:PhnB protein